MENKNREIRTSSSWNMLFGASMMLFAMIIAFFMIASPTLVGETFIFLLKVDFFGFMIALGLFLNGWWNQRKEIDLTPLSS